MAAGWIAVGDELAEVAALAVEKDVTVEGVPRELAALFRVEEDEEEKEEEDEEERLLRLEDEVDKAVEEAVTPLLSRLTVAL